MNRAFSWSRAGFEYLTNNLAKKWRLTYNSACIFHQEKCLSGFEGTPLEKEQTVKRLAVRIPPFPPVHFTYLNNIKHLTIKPFKVKASIISQNY